MKKLFDEIKKIPIGHHHIAVENKQLEYALIQAYELGFKDSQDCSINTVLEHVKDDTVKSLLSKTIGQLKSRYEYLNG